MEKEPLEKVVSEIIQNVDVEKLDKRIDTYTDFKSKYVVLKPAVKVSVELTSGKKFTIDVTDYFEGVIK